MAKKLKTNEDLVSDLMNYSPYGALCQAFITQAIENYCDTVIKWEPTEADERGFVSPTAWKGVATDIKKRMDEFYNRKR